MGEGGPRRVAIVGVGNALMADDGVGPAVLEVLEERGLPEGARLMEAGADPLSLAALIEPGEALIVVDAVRMGAEPGTVRVFGPEEASFAVDKSPSSLHGLGLADALKLMEATSGPREVTVVGIEPGELRVGRPMTRAVRDAVARAADIVLGEAGDIGRSHARNTACPPPHP